MARLEILQDYEVDPTSGVIRSPGKFEGEMLYVPYFWDHILEGDGEDYGRVTVVDVERADRDAFPELGDAKRVALWERDDGFVFCECDPSEEDLTACVDEETDDCDY